MEHVHATSTIGCRVEIEKSINSAAHGVAFFNRLHKKEKVFNSSVFFYVFLLPHNFQLGEAISNLFLVES